MTRIRDEKDSVILRDQIVKFLDEKKAENIAIIDIRGKSPFADFMIVASGTSSRHINAMGSQLKEALHQWGVTSVPIEGKESPDWVLIDGGDIVVHLFRPEVRSFYDLERMWSMDFSDLNLKQIKK